MKVILMEEIGSLGKRGEVVFVKDGYARNYLIPKDKARAATPANIKILEVMKAKESKEESKKIEAARALANKISTLSLTISMQVGETDKLFGSVSNEAISKALGEEGINIDRKDILLEEPIKKLGVYQVPVKVYPEVNATLRVWVVKK